MDAGGDMLEDLAHAILVHVFALVGRVVRLYLFLAHAGALAELREHEVVGEKLLLELLDPRLDVGVVLEAAAHGLLVEDLRVDPSPDELPPFIECQGNALVLRDELRDIIAGESRAPDLDDFSRLLFGLRAFPLPFPAPGNGNEHEEKNARGLPRPAHNIVRPLHCTGGIVCCSFCCSCSFCCRISSDGRVFLSSAFFRLRS